MNSSLPRRPGPTRRIRVSEWTPEWPDHGREDRVAVEEPLEVRLSAPGLPPRTVGVVMRTPGHDFELAAGWLVSEGIVTTAGIASVCYCTDTSLRRDQEFNVVTLEATEVVGPLPQARVVNSACG
ncbi:MAG: sulfurtransferase FdhD, partial [Myxococcales bacterium]